MKLVIFALIIAIASCAVTGSSCDASKLCEAGQYVNHKDTAKCEAPTAVTNCAEYNDFATEGTFKCTKCKDTHVLASDKCDTSRTADANCKEYELGAGCKTCNKGYWNNSGTCTVFSDAKNVSNCVKGTSATVCTHCEGLFGPVSNVCEAVTAGNGAGIPGCKYYANATTCQVCDSLKYPTSSNSVCSDIASKANCRESEGTADECKYCKGAKVLGQSKDCSASATVIDNCENYNDNGDKCIKCSDGYYSIDGGAKCDKKCPAAPVKNDGEDGEGSSGSGSGSGSSNSSRLFFGAIVAILLALF